MAEPSVLELEVSSGERIDWPDAELRAGLVPRLQNRKGSRLRFDLPVSTRVHVWAASLQVPRSFLAGFRETLSSQELDRAARFHFDEHRNRYVVGRGWLRQLLGAYLSI